VIQLESLTVRAAPGNGAAFPFSVPSIRSLETLVFKALVTFFVGENGSGKSTLLEGIAAAAHLPTIGSASVEHDPTLAAARTLGKQFRLSWRQRSHRGFFLRAEDFFGFTKSLAKQRLELQQQLRDIEIEYRDRSAMAKGLASGPALNSLHALTSSYGDDLDANSHGQSFLLLFRERFVPGGLYILDEPEAPLSPQSQLALIVMLDEMVQQGAQFIIATHSPMLLAFPGASIYSFDELPVREVPFDALDHVNITRDFLNGPENYLRRLTGAPQPEPSHTR